MISSQDDLKENDQVPKTCGKDYENTIRVEEDVKENETKDSWLEDRGQRKLRSRPRVQPSTGLAVGPEYT